VRRRGNQWYDAICTQLRVAGGPLAVDRIWEKMTSSGFQHASKRPQSTLRARIAELAQMKKIEQVGRATYRLLEGTAS
jgi:hypothetical protein